MCFIRDIRLTPQQERKTSRCRYIRQGGYVFVDVSQLVCHSVCSQDYAKTTQPISIKNRWKGGPWPR